MWAQGSPPDGLPAAQHAQMRVASRQQRHSAKRRCQPAHGQTAATGGLWRYGKVSQASPQETVAEAAILGCAADQAGNVGKLELRQQKLGVGLWVLRCAE